MSVESVGFGHQDIVFGQIVGPSGIKITIPQAVVEKFYPSGGTLRTILQAGASVTGDEAGIDFGVALQQGFDVYVTVFYIEPGPTTYTANPAAGG
jgi:hypothetical protein